jgi:hypothetical protein
MTTAQINPYPDIAPPAGVDADEWQPDEPHPYRVLSGATRAVAVHRASREGLTAVGVYTHAVQLSDGNLSHDASHGGPGVSIETRHVDEVFARDSGVELSADDARALALALIEAADVVDGWVGNRHDGPLRAVADLLESVHTDLLSAAAGSDDPDGFYQAASQLLAARARIDDAIGALR